MGHVVVVIAIAIVVAIADVVLIDRDASVSGAADSRAHVRRRRIAARTNDRNRGNLGDEDSI